MFPIHQPSDNPIVTILFILLILTWLLAYTKTGHKFFRWLKGSRTTYYLSEGGFVKSSTKKLRTPADRVGIDMKPSNQGVIEISRGWFRPSSAIYGDYHIGPWGIAKASRGCNAQGGSGGDWVDLVDCSSLPVERALHLINKYTSLQALMLENSNQRNRIAELEDKLVWTESHRKTWLASLEAIRQEIESDRQQYRSQAAQKIRTRVEQVLEHAKSSDQVPDEDSVDAIKRLWIVRDGGVPPLRRCGGQVWDLSLKI